MRSEKVITGRNTIVVMMLLGSGSLASHNGEFDKRQLDRKAFKTNWIVGDAIQDLGTLSRNCEFFAAAQYRNKLGLMWFRTI
jgi:hypothetical protein